MLREQSIVRICPNMPRMACWNLRKEVVRISHEERRLVLGHLGVEQDLGRLGHAGYRLDTEMTEGRECPSIEICGNEFSTGFG